MVQKYNRNARLFFGLAPTLLVLLPAISFFVKMQYDVSSYAEIFPREKWLLTRGRNGEMISTYIDYAKGRIDSYGLSNFERGESVSLNFSQYLGDKTQLSKGDTIALMNSTNLSDELISATSQVEVASANLRSQNSPAKEALISEAALKVVSAEKKIEEEKIIFERIKQLYTKGYSSQQEYDTEKNKLELLEIEARVNQANLQNLKTGVKPEEAALLESQIKAAKAKISFLHDKQCKYTLVAPFGGKLIPSFHADTLLNLSNWSDAVLHMPITLTDIANVKEGNNLTVYFPEKGISYTGKVLTVGKEVKMINNRQTVFVSLLIPNAEENLLPGMVLKCSMGGQSVSLARYVYETVRH